MQDKSHVLGYHSERFNERRRNLQQTCHNLSLTGMSSSEGATKSHFLLDDKHKLVYCFVEKNGCTFWKRVFQILNGFKNVSDPFDTKSEDAYGGYQTAENMPFYEIHKVLSSYTKFMFVRDPYERLLSGYVDKLFVPYAPYWFDLGRFIVQKFRQNDAPTVRSCGDDVTFEEFIRYYIYSWKTGERKDVHFSTNHEYCKPCEIKYDYIAKMENFKEETLFLIETLNLTNTIRLKDFDSESDRDAILSDIYWAFFAMKVNNCTRKDDILYKIYKKVQIRGIISKDIPFPFSDVSDVGIDEYKEALLNANAQSGPKEKRKLQRKEAFLEAYNTLPEDLFQELQNILSDDVKLFGYKSKPDILFKSSDLEQSNYHYFNKGMPNKG